ncbi:transcriptional activator leucine zipper [Suhomyces tanzawaensis NRRL Y-17324]|uniref:Transcriptional activator leucine zipper n=1 Tax=Suhomyces tanzawaensis NRRL Y-17324 TaxID=984487 RepID=A0A1E4SB93_9ASCO|nr:transcriptional activator leucine zipper [Suhomyces tanzawaensis NRRL Y-17324]ODV76748.1 transcriptional activator leucine zipper [Suhomyces tanzawaensis NRRL Y-17324]
MIGPSYDLSATPSNPQFSKISLALTEDSYDLRPQYVEYDTAQALPVHQVSPDLASVAHQVRHINLDAEDTVDTSGLALQNAPEIHSKSHPNQEQLIPEDPDLEPPYKFNFKFGGESSTPVSEEFSLGKSSYSAKLPQVHQLSSPISQVFTLSHHKEDSPQLPPPLSHSASSIKRLTLANGEEFSSIRRDLATDLKSPAEYSLHIIFTQFVRHAERKLNLCLEYPLLEEPPILDLLAEGVDPQFDKIVASLGYVARRKPKPVIDSVMFWRKSKSEVAAMAAAEVERTVATAKSSLLKLSNSSGISPTNPGIAKNSNSNDRSKRSLSLMRTKSFSKMAHRRNQSTSSAIPSITSTPSINLMEHEFARQKNYYDDQISQARETAIQADRKSLASIYILCRLLIEVVKQTSYEVMGEDLEDKLEEIVYTQLKTTDPISTSQSLVRSANWNLFAELLGFMSEKRFLSVSDRFIADLEKISSNVKLEDEPRLHLLIHGMKHLKLTNYPLEVFEESADFIQSLAKFFDKSQNETIIFAYCEVLSNLVLPLAGILTAEANHPTWVEAIEKIFYKSVQIWNETVSGTSLNKSIAAASNPALSFNLAHGSVSTISNNNGWSYALHAITSALSVSRKELFSEVWFRIIEENSFKLKPKVEVEDKITFIVCMARLVWVYLYRLPDTLNNVVKKLDSLFQILLFNSTASSKKNQWIIFDNLLINALVELIRTVGFNHLNYVLDNVLIKLLKMSFNGTSLENLSPERTILVIKSYMVILEDYELGKKPKFPTDKELDARMGDEEDLERSKRLNEFQFIARTSKNSLSHEELCRSFATLLRLLDNQYGCDIWSSSNALSPNSSGSGSKGQSTFSAFHFGMDFSYQMTKNLHIEVFATLIDSIPFTMVTPYGDKLSSNSTASGPGGISFKSIVEILTRNCVHSNPKVSSAAIKALKKLASRKNPSSLITIFAKISFQFSDKPGPNYDSDYLSSAEFNKLLKIYVDLLKCWLEQFNELTAQKLMDHQANPLAQDDEMMNKDVLNDLYQINYKNDDLNFSNGAKLKPGDELEWKTIITVIEDVEGNGLFFLCSQDSKSRYYGLCILKLVEQFDQAIYNITNETKEDKARALSPESESRKTHSRSSSKFAADIGTRLIHILEDIDFIDLIKPYRKELSVPERSRLAKLKNKKNILIKLAESDYGIDSKIWLRLYPKLLDIFFERCPMPVAMCRSIVCVRMVQMHERILEISENYKNFTSSIFSKTSSTITSTIISGSSNKIPPEILINQWKLYLIFACCSLTSTNDQKISFPNQPTHGRKRSMQMFIQHQKITSAKSVFKMVLPLLKSQQPMIKESVITGLSCLNINIFKTFLDNIPKSVNEWEIQLKKRDHGEDNLRVETIHILSNITTKFKADPQIYTDDWMIANLVSIVKNLKTFLSLPQIQINIEFQKLRRYFCILLENVLIGLKDSTNLNKWIPFEARIGCFNFLKEWCGFGEEDITNDRYSTIILKASKDSSGGSKDSSSKLIAMLELEKNLLQSASLSCMSMLCLFPIKQEIEINGNSVVMAFELNSLMNWINALFKSRDSKFHEYGRQALRNLLTLNLDDEDIYSCVIIECYSNQESPQTLESYFTIFVEEFLSRDQDLMSVPFDILCLANFLIGNDNFEIRCAALKLLKFLDAKTFKSYSFDKFTELIHSRSKIVYKKALYEVSNHLAELDLKGIYDRISFMTKYFNLVGNESRRDILSCLLPWVQTVQLKHTDVTDSPKNKDLESLSQPSIMVLNNLFEITVKFSSKISNEVEALWVALGDNSSNFDIIIDYLLTNCLERKNPIFVEHSRQIVDYLAFAKPEHQLYVIDKFIGNLQPKAMVPPTAKATNANESMLDFPYIANLWKVIPYSEKDSNFSLGQLSMIFLVDLFMVQNDQMLEKLPLLLHVTFSLLDHYLVIVQEQSISLLINLIHLLAPNESKSAETIETLRSRNLWVYDDLNNDKKGARTPKTMDSLTRNILTIFKNLSPTLQDDWSRVSLNWATTCAVRHIACRSFQVFRSLLNFLDQGMLKDMLHRLSNTISDETHDIQGFAMQILMTLNAITAELDSAELIDFPQLFWSSVACLSTIHEQEFIEVLSTMSKFVSKIDLDSPDTVSCLISTFPPKWEGKFEGLQQVILIGLRSSTSWEASIKFLDKLNTLKDSEIIGMGSSRLLMSVLANMPRYLHALGKKEISNEIENSAVSLSDMALNCDKPGLSKILISLSKNRFRSKKDFLVQTVTTIKNSFFPEFEAQSLVLLLGFLSNKIPWIKIETMNVLKQIFPLVNLQRDEFIGVGADLISPLLRLLLTDYAETALEVLDEAVVISGSQLDKDVLRMSLGNTSLKKEYEKTATLFGIPDENGWAIPMPAVTASSTRNNVHAVFSTCLVNNVVDQVEVKNEEEEEEEIHFHMEDYYGPSIVPDYGDSLSVNVEEPDASLSNVWAALDDFDSFFTKDTEQTPLVTGRREHNHSASVDTKNSSDILVPMDSAPHVYDKNASVILNRSLARTQSNTSFKSSLADSIGTSKLGEAGNSVASKRSYIPFRSSKSNFKSKNDSFTTPVIPMNSTFETQNSSTPFKTPNVTTPTLSTFNGNISGGPNSPGAYPVLDSSPYEPNRFALGNKKKSKRATKVSPNAGSPDLLYWANPSSPGVTPPASTQSGTPKLKEKRKTSQKFR